MLFSKQKKINIENKVTSKQFNHVTSCSDIKCRDKQTAQTPSLGLHIFYTFYCTLASFLHEKTPEEGVHNILKYITIMIHYIRHIWILCASNTCKYMILQNGFMISNRPKTKTIENKDQRILEKYRLVIRSKYKIYSI